MYKVIKFFTDLQDNNHAYHEGDTFPREGLKVTSDRLTELSSASNKRGVPLITEVKEAKVEEPLPFTEEEPIEEAVEEAKPKTKKTSKKKG